MMQSLLVAVLLGLSAAALAAQDAAAGEAAPPGVQLTFTPPDLEGRYTLGIFDGNGKLVRTLFCGAEQSAFRIGLNGLITTWDGKNDAGDACPPGKYAARGYVVGDVKIEGEAYHFNEWEPDVDGLAEVQEARLTEDGDLLVLGYARGDVVFRIALDGRLVWQSRSLPGFDAPPPIVPRQADPKGSYHANGSLAQLACGRDAAIVSGDRKLFVLDLRSGSLEQAEPFLGRSLALAAANMRACVADAKSLHWLALPGLTQVENQSTPVAFSYLDADGERVIGAQYEQSRIWILAGAEVASFDIPDGTVTAVSAGAGGTLWVIVRPADSAGSRAVRQYDPSGAVLRELRAAIGEPVPVSVSASRREDRICLVERGTDGLTRVRVLQRDAAKAPEEVDGRTVANWEVLFERRLERCTRFGWIDGRLVPDAGEAPLPSEIEVRLVANDLAKGPQKLKLRAAIREGAGWLCAPDGLPLVCVSGRSEAQRVALVAGTQPGSARLFLGGPAVVEEFSIRRLDRIAAFDCGPFDWE